MIPQTKTHLEEAVANLWDYADKLELGHSPASLAHSLDLAAGRFVEAGYLVAAHYVYVMAHDLATRGQLRRLVRKLLEVDKALELETCEDSVVLACRKHCVLSVRLYTRKDIF